MFHNRKKIDTIIEKTQEKIYESQMFHILPNLKQFK
jgi:hypothetical protein